MRLGGGCQSPHSVELLVEGRIYLGGRIVDAAVGVEGGRIVWIGKQSLAPPAEQVVKAGLRRLVLPGMVDMHVHMRDMGESEKEDWYTGTLSALAGGVTFVADMPNTLPPARSVRALEMKERVAREKALVDYGLYAGLPETAEELVEMAEFGVVGLKLYPSDLESDVLVSVLRKAATLGVRVVAHAEDPVVLKLAERVGPKAVTAHGALRPVEAEEAGVWLLSYLCSRLNFRLHFTHVSSAKALKAALEYKAEASVTLDTAIHYLFLDESAVEKLGGLAKVNPPLRRPDDVHALRAALVSGAIDAVVSDHAPHRLEEKLRSEYDEIPPGFPGLETCLPLLLTLIAELRAPLSLIDLYSRKPAQLLRIPKGWIGVGADADFTLVNLNKKWVIRGDRLRSKAKYTPFEGFEVIGAVEKVFIRGVLAYDGGEVLVDAGFGRRYRPLNEPRWPEA
ncbi:MAG: allantoinase AllB [Thermoprotei archaeon]|nr:MAG: allantoinase AllB [Thermoprotei archaeon]